MKKTGKPLSERVIRYVPDSTELPPAGEEIPDRITWVPMQTDEDMGIAEGEHNPMRNDCACAECTIPPFESETEELNRDASGQFAPGGNHVITMSNAKEMQARGVPIKKAKKVERQREALLREVQAVAPPGFEIDTWEDAWGFMGGLITSRGIDTHVKLRDAIKAFHAIGKATDAFPDKTRMTVHGEGGSLTGPIDVMYKLLMEARRAKSEEV